MEDRKAFRWDDEEFIEAKYDSKCFWIAAAVGIAASLYGASQASAAGERAEELMMEGGALSKAASYANAADAEALGARNAGAINKAAANNAQMGREIGYANANAIADATLINLKLYSLQSNEEVRLHRREEKWHAGEIRAVVSSSGFAVNSGSPLAYLQSEITKGLQERTFMQQRSAHTMIGMADEGLTSSLLTVKTANYNAKVTQDNAALQASVAIATATAEAAAMRRQGDISALVGVANAQAARAQGSAAAISAIGSAVGYGASAYQSWSSSQSPASSTYGNWSSTSYAGPN